MQPADKQTVRNFLANHHMAVVATSDPANATPESALVGFADDDDMCIYFQTNQNTRKAANLRQNPHVSFVIGHDPAERRTLQYEGVAEHLTDPTELKACKQRFIDKDSPVKAISLERPDVWFFKVKPTWLGYSDYAGARPLVIEHQF